MRMGINGFPERTSMEKSTGNGWVGIPMATRSMRASMKMGFRRGNGLIIIKRGKRIWKKFIFSAPRNVQTRTTKWIAPEWGK